jgi:hypothetical protein
MKSVTDEPTDGQCENNMPPQLPFGGIKTKFKGNSLSYYKVYMDYKVNNSLSYYKVYKFSMYN